MTKKQAADQAEALAHLRSWLSPGDKVCTVLRHVSRSGMMRAIDLYAWTGAEPPVKLWLSSYAARAGVASLSKRYDSLLAGGCGMDMGFSLVYSLSSALYPDGFGCIGKRCPSNDHSNGDRDYTPHKPEGLKPQRDHWHTAGGYALRHEWI
jgi:hypothetical protein